MSAPGSASSRLREGRAAHRAARPPRRRRTPVTAVVVIAARWWRAAAMRRAMVMLAVTFTLIGAVFVSVSAFTPAPGQQDEDLFGAYQQFTTTELAVGQTPPGAVPAARAALSAAVPGSHAFLWSRGVVPDSTPKSFFFFAGTDPATMIEDPDLQEGFPGRYHLDSGRWPRAPGEVAISAHQREALPDPSAFTVMSKQSTLDVVGVVTDTHARHRGLIVAGPGTFASLAALPPSRRQSQTTYEMRVLWDAPASAGDVAGALTPALPASPKAQGPRAETIVANATTRASSPNAAPEPAFASDRFVVSYLPLALVALLVASFAAASTRSAQRADTARLVALGVRPTTVTTTRAIASTAAGALAIAGGLALGWGLAALLRATVLYRLADQPLSLIPTLPGALVAIAVGALVLLVTATVWPARTTTTSGTTPASWAGAIHLSWLRRVLVAGLAITAVQAGGGPYSVLASYLMIAAVVLLGPDVLALAVAALPRARARALLTASMMRADLRRQATAVVVVAACIAVPICAGTQLVSRTASDATYGIAATPPQQIVVDATDDAQDVAGVARAISSVPTLSAPVAIRGSRFPSTITDTSVTAAGFTNLQLTGSSSFNLMVLNSAEDLRRLLGGTLPASAHKTLADGGIIDFTRTQGDQSFTIATAAGQVVRTTPTLPTARFNPGKIWRNNFAGVVLLSTMQDLDVPVTGPDTYYFTDVTPRAATAAVAAVIAAGYDSDFVKYHVPPPPPQVPPAAYVFLAALALGAFAVLLLVVGAQATRLRGYTARLIALGLTPRWTRGILTVQAGLSVGTGLVTGALAGIAGVQTTADHYARFIIPTTAITIALAAVVLAAIAATALAARRLSATGHPEVT